MNVIYGNENVAATAVALGDFELAAYLLQRGLALTWRSAGRARQTVPPDSEVQRWKDKVISMLRARGIKYPPADLTRRALRYTYGVDSRRYGEYMRTTFNKFFR